MCDDFPPEATEFPIWNRRALDGLRNDFHASPSELAGLLEVEKEEPAFDPIKVRDILRSERALGREPEYLVLGRMEMASFRHLIARGFGEESGSPLGGLYFLGIPVVTDVCPSRLEFVIEEGFSTDGPSGRSAA